MFYIFSISRKNFITFYGRVIRTSVKFLCTENYLSYSVDAQLILNRFIFLKSFEGSALKVQSCKSYNSKYMVASTQITNTEIFAFIAVQVFTLLIVYKQKRHQKQLKSRLLFKLLQNYKQLECKIFRILLKHESDHLSVLFQFA